MVIWNLLAGQISCSAELSIKKKKKKIIISGPGCAEAQADLGLCWPHITEDTFFFIYMAQPNKCINK